MKYQELRNYIIEGKADEAIANVICSNDVEEEKKRYLKLLDDAVELYGDGEYRFISSPGRSEIGGNHTDHQHGHVVAAGLNIDNLCVAKRNGDMIVNYKDPKFNLDPVDLNDLSAHEDEINSGRSLIRGIAGLCKERGCEIGGFDCLCDSRVLTGSGISSSACFEVMLAQVINVLYNDEKIDKVTKAIVGQKAENIYYGKPSGLLDQMAISCGGFTTIDFKDPSDPVIESLEFSFNDYGYELVLVNTKGDHSDLSHEYAAVPSEMKEVAHCLNVEYLADSSKEEFMKNLKTIRETVKNDRGILRAFHFFNEDARAIEEREAIKAKDIDSLLKLIRESGRSSYEYLQNVYPASRPSSQSLAIGLAMADDFLKDDGAYRVHGGGFEGTIQAIVPVARLDEFKDMMKTVFGDDCILSVKVRNVGTCTVI